MITEAHIKAALDSLVDSRVYPDVAPSGSALPRIVYQQAGGLAVAYVENTLPNQRNARMQIACWAKTRLEASTLAEQAEAALMAASDMTATPLGAYTATQEQDTGLYGTRQDFSVWSAR